VFGRGGRDASVKTRRSSDELVPQGIPRNLNIAVPHLLHQARVVGAHGLLAQGQLRGKSLPAIWPARSCAGSKTRGPRAAGAAGRRWRGGARWPRWSPSACPEQHWDSLCRRLSSTGQQHHRRVNVADDGRRRQSIADVLPRSSELAVPSRATSYTPFARLRCVGDRRWAACLASAKSSSAFNA
jgi:hypothetical protein